MRALQWNSVPTLWRLLLMRCLSCLRANLERNTLQRTACPRCQVSAQCILHASTHPSLDKIYMHARVCTLTVIVAFHFWQNQAHACPVTLNITHVFLLNTQLLFSLLVTRVLWGTRQMLWQGDVIFTCPQTKFQAKTTFKTHPKVCNVIFSLSSFFSPVCLLISSFFSLFK